MRRYLTNVLLIVFCISFFHLFSVRLALSQQSGLTAGGFQWGGSVELGYRLTDIDGSKDRYREIVNLRDGLKLFDFSLRGRSINAKYGACFKCHPEKKGPWVYEHLTQKVEGCLACHEPHGSTNRFLLIRRDVKDLCAECHGRRHFPNQSCINCHTQIHGSNFSSRFLQ